MPRALLLHVFLFFLLELLLFLGFLERLLFLSFFPFDVFCALIVIEIAVSIRVAICVAIRVAIGGNGFLYHWRDRGRWCDICHRNLSRGHVIAFLEHRFLLFSRFLGLGILPLLALRLLLLLLLYLPRALLLLAHLPLAFLLFASLLFACLLLALLFLPHLPLAILPLALAFLENLPLARLLRALFPLARLALRFLALLLLSRLPLAIFPLARLLFACVIHLAFFVLALFSLAHPAVVHLLLPLPSVTAFLLLPQPLPLRIAPSTLRLDPRGLLSCLAKYRGRVHNRKNACSIAAKATEKVS
mmetsp:Transcript_61020/g.170698  ORF Transcript_61020/g.170698 Transcript_61020/m.170698 type:complete len:302 (+) Transcript_61020:372-1277(+)